MSILDTVIAALPLLNFLLIWVLKPIYDSQKSLKQTISNQQEEIKQLKEMNATLKEEVRLLKELVFRTIPAEKLQEHLLCHIKDKPGKE